MGDLPPVLLLAGGLGTRIRTMLGDTLPKAMVPVNGEPFVSLQMQLLARQGAHRVIFCVQHLAQPLQAFLADGSQFGLQIEYSFDGEQLIGTAGAVRQAAELAGEEFAVLYGDSYLDIDFRSVFAAYRKAGKRGLTTVYKNDNQLIKSNMLFRDGEIIAYDKSANAPEGMQHVDFGLSFYHRNIFGEVKAVPLDLSVVTQKLIAERELAGYEVLTRFYEVGTPDGVRDLEHYLKSRS